MKYVTRSFSGAALGEYTLEQSLGRHRQFRTREQLAGLIAKAGYSADVHFFCSVLMAGQPDVLLQGPPLPEEDLAIISCRPRKSFRKRAQYFAPECALSRRNPEALTERPPGP